MSKYQIFATPGSFRANQLKAPDESGKILEAAEKKIRGMDRAQAFLEGNRELYLRAQRYAQEQERMDRQANFEFETQNRKAYQDALRRDTEIALQNDERQSAQTQQLYKDLSAFSKTAFEVYGTFEEQRKKKRQALATQEVLKSGLDYNQLKQLTSIDQKLTDSQFRQTEFIQSLIDAGASEERINVLGNIWRRNAPSMYLDNQAALQNSFLSYAPGLSKKIEDLGEKATIEQIKAVTQTYTSEFITNNLSGVRTEMLESSGLLRHIRSHNNQTIAGYNRVTSERRKAEVKARFRDDIQTIYNKDGLEGVMKILQTNPERWKREEITKWAVASIKVGGPYGLSEEEGQALLEYPLTIGNQQVPFGKQFIYEAGQIHEALRAARSREMSDYRLRQAEERAQGEAELAQLFDSFAVDGDGRIDAEELAVLQERANDLGLKDSEVVAYAQTNSVNAETDRAVERYLGEKADNLTLTIEDVNGLKMGANLRRRFLQIAKEQAQTRESPIFKDHVKVIENAISEHPQVKEARAQLGRDDYSVILMQNRYKQQYKANLKRLDSPDEALSLTLQQIKTMQSNVAAVNDQGRYVEIEEEVQRRASQASKSLKEYQELMKAMSSDRFRKDAKFAVNSVGAANFYNSYNAMSEGGQPNTVIKSGAELMGVDPLTFINYLAEGANVEPIKPLNDELQKLKESLPPITRRLYDTYRTPERINRANTTTFGGLATAPVRGNVSSNEKQALDYIAKYESESAGGYDAVNQGGAEGGTKVLGYSGPFSLMPQHGNRPLTSLTIAEIMALQADPGSSMSMQEWFNAGKLHAVGRYQFIGPTLASVVRQMGINPNTKFTPDVQDKMALWLLRNSANGIGQWVGPANYATAQERAIINAVR